MNDSLHLGFLIWKMGLDDTNFAEPTEGLNKVSEVPCTQQASMKGQLIHKELAIHGGRTGRGRNGLELPHGPQYHRRYQMLQRTGLNSLNSEAIGE